MKCLWNHGGVSPFKSLNLALTVSIHSKSIGSLKNRSWMGEKLYCARTETMQNCFTQEIETKKLRLSPKHYLHRAHPPRTAQILLIFGFMHSWIATGRLLRLKRVALSCPHVRCLLVHLLELHVRLELMRHLWNIETRRIDRNHLCCRAAFKDSWRMSRMIIRFDC